MKETRNTSEHQRFIKASYNFSWSSWCEASIHWLVRLFSRRRIQRYKNMVITLVFLDRTKQISRHECFPAPWFFMIWVFAYLWLAALPMTENWKSTVACRLCSGLEDARAKSLNHSPHWVINEYSVDGILDWAQLCTCVQPFNTVQLIKVNRSQESSCWPAHTSFNRFTSSFQVLSNCTILEGHLSSRPCRPLDWARAFS